MLNKSELTVNYYPDEYKKEPLGPLIATVCGAVINTIAMLLSTVNWAIILHFIFVFVCTVLTLSDILERIDKAKEKPIFPVLFKRWSFAENKEVYYLEHGTIKSKELSRLLVNDRQPEFLLDEEIEEIKVLLQERYDRAINKIDVSKLEKI